MGESSCDLFPVSTNSSASNTMTYNSVNGGPPIQIQVNETHHTMHDMHVTNLFFMFSDCLHIAFHNRFYKSLSGIL